MANNDICVCVLMGEHACKFVTKKLPCVAHFEHKYFLYPRRIFLCMHQSCLISRVGVPSLADCDQSHLCNQWFRISRTAPVKKSEIFYLSFWVWISLFVSRDFPLAVCPTQSGTVVFPHRATGFECNLLHLRACLCVRAFMQAVTSESSNIKGVELYVASVEPVIDLGGIFLKELRHWDHQGLLLPTDMDKLNFHCFSHRLY